MKYKSFTIKNYKGIGTVNIDFTDNAILTLVGLNESGKTTILEAIHLFYRYISGVNLTKAEITNFRPKSGEFSDDIIIQSVLELDSEDKKTLVSLIPCGKGKSLKIPDTFTCIIKFKFELSEYKTSASEFIFSVTGAPKNFNEQQCILEAKKLIPEILFYEDFIFDIPEKIKFYISEEEPDTKDDRNTAWQLVLDDIIRETDSNLNIQKHIVEWSGDDENKVVNRITRMDSILNTKITSAWQALFTQNNKKLNFKEICISHTSNGLHAFSFDVKTDDGDTFPINERSKGCKWFFSFLLFTELRKNRSKNILFLLDEPASNLHSSAQVKILKAIESLSDKSMVIYSTHSHHLINPKWLKGAYVIINDALSEAALSGDVVKEQKTSITAEKYFKYVGTGKGIDRISYYQPILDALDYRPSTLEPVPDIVLVEGKSDFLTFKYFDEVIFKNKKILHFYPGAGAGKLGDIIRLYVAWGKNFIVLLDGDNAGERAKSRYINDIGLFIQDKIYTLKDISGKVQKLEDLIEISDKDTILKSLGTNSIPSTQAKKNKTMLTQSINLLLKDKKAINISQTTKDNFSLVFRFLGELKH